MGANHRTKLTIGISAISALSAALAVAWVASRGTTGQEAFCVPDLTRAESEARVSWSAARRLILHYEMCADDKQSWEKARLLYGFWISRHNPDATFEFAEDQINSKDLTARHEGERLMALAAKWGQADATEDTEARNLQKP